MPFPPLFVFLRLWPRGQPFGNPAVCRPIICHGGERRPGPGTLCLKLSLVTSQWDGAKAAASLASMVPFSDILDYYATICGDPTHTRSE